MPLTFFCEIYQVCLVQKVAFNVINQVYQKQHKMFSLIFMYIDLQ